jgi:hypothetical protein
MKMTVVILVLGAVAGATNCHGQGSVVFSSYLANNGAGAITTYQDSIHPPVPLSSSYTAGLYYALGTLSDPVNEYNVPSMISMPAAGFTDSGVSAVYDSTVPAGYFSGPSVIIPGYVSGPITFEVVAYNGSSYAASTFRARSGSFTMNNLISAPALGDNGQQMLSFIVPALSYVPEPTSASLLILGSIGFWAGLKIKRV